MNKQRLPIPRAQAQPVLTIDYNDVMIQAIANARDNAYREILLIIEETPATKKDPYSSYRREDLKAEVFKADVLTQIRRKKDNQ